MIDIDMLKREVRALVFDQYGDRWCRTVSGRRLRSFDDQGLDSDADVEYILEETRERIQERHSQNQKLNCLSVIVRI